MDVECKTISADKGNAIHLLDAMNFLEVVGPPLLKGLGEALWTVDITFDVGARPGSGIGRQIRCDGRAARRPAVGLRDFVVVDPTGVLWRIGQAKAAST